MMKKMLFAVALVVVSISATAQPRWMEIAKNGNGSVFYIDASHAIKQQDNTAWGKVELGRPIAIDGKKAASIVSKIEVDCQSRASRRTDNLFYDRKGVNVARHTDGNAEMASAAPGSIDEMMIEVVCKK